MSLPPLSAHGGMRLADYAAIAAYLVLTFGISLWFGHKQQSTTDFFLGGRRMPWFVVGLSILATLMSTSSYLGQPGEIIKHGVGLFAGTLAIPFSMVVVLCFWVPFFMRLRLTSAYEYLELRFNYAVRLIAALLFILLRVGWMSMVVYVASMAIDRMKGDDLTWLPGPDLYWWITAVGLFAAVYTSIGGIQAMIWTDVLQFILMLAGVLFAIGFVFVMTHTGPVDWWQAAAAHSVHHTSPKLFSLDPTVRVTIVTAALASFFWTICTHGSDQVVLQRYFSTNSLASARRSYLINVIADTTMLALLSLTGLALLAFYLGHPDRVPEGTTGDKLFPYFLAHELPAGLGGLILAGFLCDAMQTLESGVNSITAVVTTDMIDRFRLGGRRMLSGLTFARLLSIGLALVITLNAYWVAYMTETSGQSIIEMMPKTFNMFLGPLAALMFAGMFLPRCTAYSVIPAVGFGFLTSVLWSWWAQLFGTPYTLTFTLAVAVPCLATFAMAALLSLFTRGSAGVQYTWWAVMQRPAVQAPADASEE